MRASSRFAVAAVIAVCFFVFPGADGRIERISERDGRITDSGTCGKDLAWSFCDEDKILRISGTGMMDNYTTSSSSPWEKHKSTITEIIIDEGVTSIGTYAFHHCGSLTKILIPESMTQIGSYAFQWCDKLPSIYFSENIVSLGYSMFDNCHSLTSLSIPSKVTMIDHHFCCVCKSLENVSLPSGLSSIEEKAFSYCSKLTKVTIPENVKKIGGYAFYRCDSLTSITIPANVSQIGVSAFSSCPNLASINVDDDNLNFTSKNGVLFNSDNSMLLQFPAGKNVATYNVPGSVTSIANYAFDSCILTNVTIPAGCSSIGQGSFSNCIKLESIDVDGNNKHYSSIDGVVFKDDNTTLVLCPPGKKGEYNIPDGVVTLESQSFASCTELTKVTIPNSVRTIGNRTFFECKKMQTLGIPDGVESIGEYAFGEMKQLLSITIPESVTSIGSFFLRGSVRLINATIQANISSLADYSFFDCQSLKKVTLPDSLSIIRDSAFENCIKLTTISIPEKVTTIKRRAFYGCSDLKSVTLRGEVSSIEEQAFDGCSNLQSIVIPRKVKSIEPSVFNGCKSLKTVNVKGNLTTIGDNAFNGCSSLTGISIPASVVTIGNFAFYKCDSIPNVSIPASVTTIGQAAFSSCSSLSSIMVESLNQNYESIDGVLFKNHSSRLVQFPAGREVEDYFIPDETQSIESYSFVSCKIKMIVIPKSVATIGDYAFSQCPRLQTVFYLGTNCVSSENVFYSSSALTDVCVPPDFESNKFCGVDITSGNDFCSSFRSSFNHCYEMVVINQSLVLQERSNASDWILQTSDCMEHVCDNNTGKARYSKCNSSEGETRVCVKDECLDSYVEDAVTVVVEFGEEVLLQDLNISEIIRTVAVESGVDGDTITVGWELDEEGHVIHLFLIVNDKETANIIVNELNDVKNRSDCHAGILCRTKTITIVEPTLSAATKSTVEKCVAFIAIFIALNGFSLS